VQIVLSVGVVDQANRLPAPVDPQLEHDRVALQRPAVELTNRRASTASGRMNGTIIRETY